MNTIRSVTTGTNNGSSPTVSAVVPSGVQIGDVLTIFHYNNLFALSNMPAPVVSPGSPAVVSVPAAIADNTVSVGHIKTWTCVVNALDVDGTVGVSVTETGSAGEDKHLVVICSLGTDTTNPIDDAAAVSSGGSSTPTQAAPAANPATSDGLLVCVVSSCGGSATNGYTTPGSMTELAETHTGFLSAVVGSQQLVASGSTGTRTFTANGPTTYVAVSVVLRAAPTGADVTPPSVPAGLYFAAVNETSIQLAWAASVDNVGVAGYDVFINDVLAAVASSPSYTASGLTPATVYSFKVRARDAAGNTSAFTQTISARTDASTAVAAPTIELAFQRAVTDAFIAADPTTLTLIPTVLTDTRAGGRVRSAGLPRVAQVFKLIETSSGVSNQPGLIRTQDGAQRRQVYVLLGRWDALIEVGDHWIEGQTRYEVVEMLPENGYERRGRVVHYG